MVAKCSAEVAGRAAAVFLHQLQHCLAAGCSSSSGVAGHDSGGSSSSGRSYSSSRTTIELWLSGNRGLGSQRRATGWHQVVSASSVVPPVQQQPPQQQPGYWQPAGGGVQRPRDEGGGGRGTRQGCLPQLPAAGYVTSSSSSGQVELMWAGGGGQVAHPMQAVVVGSRTIVGLGMLWCACGCADLG